MPPSLQKSPRFFQVGYRIGPRQTPISVCSPRPVTVPAAVTAAASLHFVVVVSGIPGVPSDLVAALQPLSTFN